MVYLMKTTITCNRVMHQNKEYDLKCLLAPGASPSISDALSVLFQGQSVAIALITSFVPRASAPSGKLSDFGFTNVHMYSCS